MKTVQEASGKTLGSEDTFLCLACGYDLEAHELDAALCPSCSVELKVQQNTAIFVTAPPPAKGTAKL